MLSLFANNLLPVFLASGTGYLVAARSSMSVRPIAHIGFYILSPCLVFHVIVQNRVSGEAMLKMAGFTLASLLVLVALTALVGRLFKWSRSLTAAAMLVVMLPNAGNFGLSANLFAFGQEALTHASLYFVTMATLTYTVGVVIASMGRARVGEALGGLPRVPTIWAVAVAFLMVQFGWALPTPLARTVKLLADACIPVFLIVLGMQLHGATWRNRLLPLGLTTGMRLVVGIALGLGLAAVFGLEGPARQAGILQSAMPSAVITIILATQYDVEPGFVTSVVFVSTIISPLTLTPLLAYLGA